MGTFFGLLIVWAISLVILILVILFIISSIFSF